MAENRPSGVIYPPPDIRTIIDKTATFVSRNGGEFEKKIISSNAGNAKFNFLQLNDPYHAYYLLKLEEFKKGPQGAPAAPAPSSAPAPATPAAQAALQSQTVQQTEKAAVPKVAPEKDRYYLKMRHAMTVQDFDIIKLTAQFAAINGEAFLGSLTARESRNPMFEFLKPTSIHYDFFQSMMKAYSLILKPEKKMFTRMETDLKNKFTILDRIKNKLEWMDYEDQKKEEEKEATDVQMTMQRVDWQHFVVVETITFEDQVAAAPLPPPATQPPAPAPQAPKPPVPEAPAEEDMDVDMDVDEEVAPATDLKVVKDYRPGQGVPSTVSSTVKTEICPRCGQVVPVDEMPEHIRIELLDPRWAQQRDAMLAKLPKNAHQQIIEPGETLNKLAHYRSDIFGHTSDVAPPAPAAPAVQWDGHSMSSRVARQQARALAESEEVIAARKAREEAERAKIYGPGVPEVKRQRQ